MKPRVGGLVLTPDGPAEYRGPLQSHGMALVVFPDGTSALYDPRIVYVLGVAGVTTPQDFMAARVAHMLALPAVQREGN